MSRPNLPSRTTEIVDLKGIAGTYLRAGSPRIMVGAVILAFVIRMLIGRFGWHDIVALVIVVAAVGSIEWVIHKFLLHAPETSWRTRTLGTSVSHRRHHEDPTHIEHVLLAPAYAAGFLPAIAAFTLVWAVPVSFIFGFSLLPTLASGLLASWLTLAHYEWVHLAVHTRHRFSNRYYARLARNHRLHHYRNENYWLGVTSNSGDRLLNTLPADKSDVSLSDTARRLG